MSAHRECRTVVGFAEEVIEKIGAVGTKSVRRGARGGVPAENPQAVCRHSGVTAARATT